VRPDPGYFGGERGGYLLFDEGGDFALRPRFRTKFGGEFNGEGGERGIHAITSV